MKYKKKRRKNAGKIDGRLREDEGKVEEKWREGKGKWAKIDEKISN